MNPSAPFIQNEEDEAPPAYEAVEGLFEKPSVPINAPKKLDDDLVNEPQQKQYQNNFCPQCGFKISPPGKFCAKCGFQIVPSSTNIELGNYGPVIPPAKFSGENKHSAENKFYGENKHAEPAMPTTDGYCDKSWKYPLLSQNMTIEIKLTPPEINTKRKIQGRRAVLSPGQKLPDGLSIVEGCKIVGQPTESSKRTNYRIRLLVVKGYSDKEKGKRRAARMKKHKKIVAKKKKEVARAKKKGKTVEEYVEPALPVDPPEEQDRLEWILVRVSLAVATRPMSFIDACCCYGFCPALLCEFSRAWPCWMSPFLLIVAVATSPVYILIDAPPKLFGLIYFILAVPIYILGVGCQNMCASEENKVNCGDACHEPASSAESCFRGIDQDGTIRFDMIYNQVNI